MPRPPVPDDVRELRRKIASEPGTQAEHAARAGLTVPGWCGFLATYRIHENRVTAARQPRSSAPSVPPAALPPRAEPAPELRGLALVVDVLRRDRGELTAHEIRERLRKMGRDVAEDLTPLLEEEAARVGAVTWGAKLGTWRACCPSCARPY